MTHIFSNASDANGIHNLRCSLHPPEHPLDHHNAAASDYATMVVAHCEDPVVSDSATMAWVSAASLVSAMSSLRPKYLPVLFSARICYSADLSLHA